MSLFLLSWFPACWACHFHCAGFSSCSACTVGAFSELGFCCAWPQPHRGQAEVVSARLNLSQGTIFVGEVCNFLCFVLLQQKIKEMDGPVLQLFHLASKEKYILDAWGWADPKDVKRREARGSILAPLFMSPPPTPSLPCVNCASQEGYLFHLGFSLWSSNLPLFYSRGLFPSLCFSHRLSGLLFPF